MSDETMKDIIDRIKKRRLELEYSFQDLANLTDMSKSTLQRYEAGGIKNIPLDKLKILATALKVTPEWILGWDEQENSRTQDSEEIEIKTIAAHAVGNLSEKSIKKIIEYAKYIKSQENDDN